MSGFEFDHGAERRLVLTTRALLLGLAALGVAGGGLWWTSRSPAQSLDSLGESGSRASQPSPELVLAAAQGDLETVERELEAGADPDSRGAGGASALTEALAAGETEIARCLLRAGAAVDAGGAGRTGDLALAAEQDDAFVIALLVNAGASVAARDAEQATPLHVAAEAGRANCVAALLDARADVEAVDRHGFTPLARAVLLARADAVRALLARGASPDALDARGRGVVQLAAAAGDAELVRLLLEAGADPRIADGNGWTSLHEAAALGRTEALRALLPGFDPVARAARTARGATALHLAARRGEVHCVELLLDAGLDPTLRDADGRTARDLAPREVVDAPWARLGQATLPQATELDESALLDDEPRRPLIFAFTRRVSAGPEDRIALELAVWEDGAALCSAWGLDGAQVCSAGILPAKCVQSALSDLEDAGWFATAPPLDGEGSRSGSSGARSWASSGRESSGRESPGRDSLGHDARSDRVEWILAHRTGFVRRAWDSVDRSDDGARRGSRARFAAWALARSKAGDILRTLRPGATRDLSFALVDGTFRGISFERGVSAPWLR